MIQSQCQCHLVSRRSNRAELLNSKQLWSCCAWGIVEWNIHVTESQWAAPNREMLFWLPFRLECCQFLSFRSTWPARLNTMWPDLAQWYLPRCASIPVTIPFVRLILQDAAWYSLPGACASKKWGCPSGKAIGRLGSSGKWRWAELSFNRCKSFSGGRPWAMYLLTSSKLCWLVQV